MKAVLSSIWNLVIFAGLGSALTLIVWLILIAPFWVQIIVAAGVGAWIMFLVLMLGFAKTWS